MDRRARTALLLIMVVGLAVGLAFRFAFRAAEEGRARSGAVPSEPSYAAPPASEPPPPPPPTPPRTPTPPERTLRDRAARDAVRAAIYRAWSAGALPSSASAVARGPDPRFAPMPERPGGGGVDPAYIRDRVHDDFVPMAQACYEQLLHRDRDATGTALMSFVLLGDEQVGGVVDEATLVVADGGTAMGDAEFSLCLRESMMAMAFRPPPRGGRVEVRYPFRFAPETGDAGP